MREPSWTASRAGANDLEPVLELMEAFYRGEGYPFDRAASRAALAALLEDDRLGRVWLFREGDDAVGYCVLTLGWSLEYHGRDAFIDELYVAPSHRGQGMGARALAILDDACRELGVHALHLEVERGNLTARELYRNNGFEESERFLMSKRFDRAT